MKVEIKDLGLFTSSKDSDGTILFYVCPIQFRRQSVELIVYPSSEGNVPEAEVQFELAQMFVRFNRELENALTEFPSKLRGVCAEYQLNVDHVTDTQMISNIEWQNIKLENDGMIECTSSNTLVTCTFDIVVGFTTQMKIDYVFFDG